MFSLFVSATDALGTYAFFQPSSILASITWFECPVGGGFCNRSGAINYSLDVVATAVSEPATLGLFGLGLVGLVAFRRRQTRRAEA